MDDLRAPLPNEELLVGRRPRHYDANAAAASGLVAGLFAGVLTALALLAHDLLDGHSPWFGPRSIAAVFLGPGARGETFAGAPLLVGVAAHLGLSIVFGLAFGLVAFCWQRATVVWSGLLYGVLVYAFMILVALPVVAPRMIGAELSWFYVGLHVLFGAAIGGSFEALRFRSAIERGVTPHGETVTIRPHAPSAGGPIPIT